MAMKTQSRDTAPQFEKVQFDLLRKAGAAQRLRLARAHTQSATHLARRRIARAHPEWSDQEVALHWAALTYGEDLAERVRDHLRRRENAD